MSRKFIVSLLLTAALAAACAKNNQSNQSVQNTTNTTTTTTNVVNKTETTVSTPETTKSEDGFAASESGTAKATPTAGKANVQGKVLFDGKPAENIEVKLCEKFEQFLDGCTGQILTARTDASGEYLFANITPRVYEALTVKVFNTRGYVFPTSSFGISATKFKIEPDKTFFVSETNLFKNDLKVQSPKNVSKISAPDLEVKWDAYPNASYYEVSINSGDGGSSDYINEKVDTNSFRPEKLLIGGKYNLKVEAYNADRIKIADSGYDYIEFTISGGAGGSGNSNQ